MEHAKKDMKKRKKANKIIEIKSGLRKTETKITNKFQK